MIGIFDSPFEAAFDFVFSKSGSIFYGPISEDQNNRHVIPEKIGSIKVLYCPHDHPRNPLLHGLVLSDRDGQLIYRNDCAQSPNLKSLKNFETVLEDGERIIGIKSRMVDSSLFAGASARHTVFQFVIGRMK